MTVTDRTSPYSSYCATAGCGRRATHGDLCEVHGPDVVAFVAWLHDDDGPRGFERQRSIWRANLDVSGLTVIPVGMTEPA